MTDQSEFNINLTLISVEFTKMTKWLNVLIKVMEKPFDKYRFVNIYVKRTQINSQGMQKLQFRIFHSKFL